LDSELS
jgi:hypothetical protein